MHVVALQQPEPKNDDFGPFWQIYPRRIAKAHALKMWLKLSEDEQKAALRALPQHVRYWRITGTDMAYIPHAATWINQRRFEDEITTGQLPAPSTCCTCDHPSGGFVQTSGGRQCGRCYQER